MQGLSPRPYSMTLQQTQTSTAVTEAVQELPTTVADLISQMAVPDFSLAAQTLELDKYGEVIQNQGNLDILAAIESALTSPSSECDPKIKSQIFTNATKTHGVLSFVYGQYCITGMLRSYLTQILNALTKNGLQINLDDVVLTNLDLSHIEDRIDLRGMSARQAQFSNINMRFLKLDGADFTGATFTDINLSHANLSNADITGATFSNVQFGRTLACAMTGNQTAIKGISAVENDFAYLIDDSVSRTASTYLNGMFLSAAPDTDKFTFAAQKNVHIKG